MKRGAPLRRTRLRPRSKKAARGAREWAQITDRRYADVGGRCEGCGVAKRREDAHGHHRLPRGRGGKNEYGNCVIVCADCHRRAHGYEDGYRHLIDRR